MGQLKLVCPDAVLEHEQPASQPSLDMMASVANHGLRYLRHQRVRVMKQSALHHSTSAELFLKFNGSQPVARACSLHGGDLRLTATQKRGDTNDALVAYESDFHPGPVFQISEQRNDRRGKKMNILNLLIRPEKNLAEAE
jgi:hypothetical protein